MPKEYKLSLNSGIQTNQILTNDDEVCIPRLSSILLAVSKYVIDYGSFTALQKKRYQSHLNQKFGIVCHTEVRSGLFSFLSSKI